jgi:hypothetical protein
MIEKYEGKRQIERTLNGRKSNIQLYLKEMVQSRVQRRAYVITAVESTCNHADS